MERLASVTVVSVDRTKNEACAKVEGTATTVDQMVAAIQGAGKFQAKVAAA